MNHASDILSLWARKGALTYDGEGISQLEHAWQCGQLALQAGATPALQLASWLHDIGHLMTDLPGSPTLHGIDDRHENLGAQALLPLWGAAVAEPVRLHVQAKRYMVAARPGYADKLSVDSVRSLALQGGPMSSEECRAFAALPFALEAQQLRAWDDSGKRVGWFAADADAALAELQALMALVSSRAQAG
ncbi:phosphohydrolase [Rhodoferax lacus]|uniref:phosphohydrolase n=1 Tax=Rhodoferax lacus TaxID=2184758 RepID=UPI0018F4817B|nr:phosphohydrolase [Rhodoferax lacus]